LAHYKGLSSTKGLKVAKLSSRENRSKQSLSAHVSRNEAVKPFACDFKFRDACDHDNETLLVFVVTIACRSIFTMTCGITLWIELSKCV